MISQTESGENIWIKVGFDGAPHRIAKELTDNTVKCFECGDMIDLKEESFEEHLEELHHGEANIGMEVNIGICFWLLDQDILKKTSC